jgi:hypothetical protein
MRLTKVETKGAAEVMKLSISWCHSECRLCVKYQYSAFFLATTQLFSLDPTTYCERGCLSSVFQWCCTLKNSHRSFCIPTSGLLYQWDTGALHSTTNGIHQIQFCVSRNRE